MLHAGVPETLLDEVMKILGPRLLRRFESQEGYKCFPETLRLLKELRKSNVKISAVSNSDPRILKTLSSLQILPLLTHPPTLSYYTNCSKPDPEMYRIACASCDEIPGEGVLMVGDELEADYNGSLKASLEPRLITRVGSYSAHTERSLLGDIEGKEVIDNLWDIVQEGVEVLRVENVTAKC
ncbi:hypothetical protein M231_03315 [Tremella mesenterica]|uniref:HAD hydrolase, family IA n=1 Tax=Tremella mesenterica TaxID=5217 RepID=A0A4Q1BNC2_TREME|nr:hypothetical protein M231_03315 [Tremella mesenterica]